MTAARFTLQSKLASNKDTYSLVEKEQVCEVLCKQVANRKCKLSKSLLKKTDSLFMHNSEVGVSLGEGGVSYFVCFN